MLVIYTVECSAFVAKQIVSKIDDSDVEVVGFQGCTDNDYAVRMLLALIRHPNIGGVLAVGLGCEYIQPERLAQKAAEAGKEADWFFVQDIGGTKKSIERGVESVRATLPTIKQWITASPFGSIRSAQEILRAACPPSKKRAWARSSRAVPVRFKVS